MTALATAFWGKVLLGALALLIIGALVLGVVLACLYPKGKMTNDQACARAETCGKIIKALFILLLILAAVGLFGGAIFGDGGISGLDPANPCPLGGADCREKYKERPYYQQGSKR